MTIQRDDDRIVVVVQTTHLRVALAVMVGLAALAGLFVASRAIGRAADRNSARTIADSAAWAGAPRFEVATAGRPSRGPTDAPVTIVEFTDYKCPYCRRHASEVVPGLLARYGDRLRYVVRNFPIQSLNPEALPAAEAAECAHRQGRFWEYRAVLFRETGRLTADRLTEHAAASGLDAARFRRCVEDRATRETVQHDLLDAWEHGVSGTPTFFINGRRFRGARPLEELATYVELAASGSAR